MKKIFIIIVILVIAIGLYLYLANAYTYYCFNQVGLTAPNNQGNYEFNSQSMSQNLIYVALGDSLTSGMGLAKYEESFPYLLAKDYGGDKVKITLKNFSYPGYRTDDLIKDLLTPAIESKPQIITLLIGVNDIHGFYGQEKFNKNYQVILERLTKETKAKIYLISIPDIGASVFMLPFNYYFSQQTAEFNNIIKQLAEIYGVKYIDISGPTEILEKTAGFYAADKFHPSALGQASWEKIIFSEIKSEF